MKRKLSVVVASLAGGMLVHLVLVACGSSGSAVSPASAQTAPSCTSWHVAGYYYSASGFSYGQSFPSDTVFAEQALPAGWEPMSATPLANGNNSAGALVAMRRCVQ
jgi:hypothetical protein